MPCKTCSTAPPLGLQASSRASVDFSSPFAAAKDALAKWQQLEIFPLGPVLGASSALQDVLGVVGSSPAAAPQALSIGAPAAATDEATLSAPARGPCSQ